MRVNKTYGYMGEFKSSFLSCEKDAETIIKKLFVNSRPYSDELKRLLIIPNKDCIDDRTNKAYLDKLTEYSVSKLFEEGYIRLKPQVGFNENEEMKNYLIITFDDFIPNATNEYFRDCLIMITIICNTDNWDIGNYRQRPLKIAGYIDGILNESRLSGIGTLEFFGCNEVAMNKDETGYVLTYRAVHADDDEDKAASALYDE